MCRSGCMGVLLLLVCACQQVADDHPGAITGDASPLLCWPAPRGALACQEVPGGPVYEHLRLRLRVSKTLREHRSYACFERRLEPQVDQEILPVKPARGKEGAQDQEEQRDTQARCWPLQVQQRPKAAQLPQREGDAVTGIGDRG